MSSREEVLQLLACSLDRKLTRADVRRSQHLLKALPHATVNGVILAFSEQQIHSKK